ncbi:cytochrome P450 [Undibacterium sp. SXout7W]|uniref:cytochrome P450 n=1 Tax=Undibacterium sp. SXout7W TaxID=3413049 RepID=UPI003BF33931
MSVLRDPRFSTQRASRWINSSISHTGNAGNDCDSDNRAGGTQAHRSEIAELKEFKRIFARSLMFLNGSHHARLRKVMNAGFKPVMLQSVKPRIQALVKKMAANLEPDHGSRVIDFMNEFARPLPALVIAGMLGVDAADEKNFLIWSDQIAAFIGTPTPSMEVALLAQEGIVALNNYFSELLPYRRAHPGQDLISQLIAAELAGGVITTKELLAQCCTLLFAGHETTRNLLGNGMLCLLTNTAQRTALQHTPSLLPSALKEILRYDSPVQFTGRLLTADVQMHGQLMKKGDLVIPFIGAANRDPAKFSHPDQLDFSRDEGNHLSFGYGAHVCIGATLSYMEGEIAFNAMLPMLSRMVLEDATPDWGCNPVYRGLHSLKIRLTATTS